jgi:hypothetical protein
MSSDIANLLQRLTLIEGATTPVSVKQGLNPQQQSVDQLPALFQPKKISVLGSKTDPEHPMQGRMVGDDVQIDVAQTPLEEKIHDVEESMLDRVRRDLNSYLDTLRDTARPDRKLVQKAKQGIGMSMDEDPTESEPTPAYTPTPTINPIMPESAVTAIAMEDGRTCEVYGDADRGYEIGHAGRRLNTRFITLEQATMAIEMYRRRCASEAQGRDYLDEA